MVICQLPEEEDNDMFMRPNKACLITLAGLLCSLGSVFAALKAQPWLAFGLLMFAGIADMLDGVVARRMTMTEQEQELGKHLDSLVDVCSFGFAPVVLLFSCGLSDALGMCGLAVYMVAVVWRLATFPLIGVDEGDGRRVYRGLPVTYSAVFLPLSSLLAFINPAWMPLVFLVMVLVLSVLMLSRIPIPRPGTMGMVMLILLALILAACFAKAGMDGRLLFQGSVLGSLGWG
jgi:CDP-diacylglycerol---serine O-phosphatidyltransferase